MTPKEAKLKAKELVLKFPMNGLFLEYGDAPRQYKEHAKKCALIAVDEILNNDGFTQFDVYLTEYWQQVKEEIQKL